MTAIVAYTDHNSYSTLMIVGVNYLHSIYRNGYSHHPLIEVFCWKAITTVTALTYNDVDLLFKGFTAKSHLSCLSN